MKTSVFIGDPAWDDRLLHGTLQARHPSIRGPSGGFRPPDVRRRGVPVGNRVRTGGSGCARGPQGERCEATVPRRPYHERAVVPPSEEPRVPAPTLPDLRRLALGGAAVAALALAGCGDSESGDAGTDPAAVIPASAPLYFELTVRPDGDLRSDVEAVAKKVLRTQDPAAEITKAIDQVVKDQDGASFDKSIDPWLGDKAAVAITSLRDPEKPDFAVAIASKDNDKAFEALKGDGKDTVEAEYDGEKYLRETGDDDLVAGPAGDTFVIGTEAGYKSAVDAAKADSQLDDAAAFKKARENTSQDDALGFVYIDVLKGVQALTASEPLIASQIEPLQQALGGATSVTAAIAVDDGAIRIETAQQGLPAQQAAGDPAAALADLPGGTVLGVGLGEIGAIARQAIQQIGSIGPVAGQDPQTLLRGLESSLGLSIEDDLLSWMGQGALFVQGRSLTDVGGGLVVTSKDPAKTKAALTKIVPLIERFSGQQVVQRAPAGADAGFRVPLGDGAPFELLVGLKDDRFVVGVNPTLVQKTLEGGSGDRLGDQAAFKAAAAKVGDGIKPAFYLDFPTVVSFLALGAGSDPSFQQAKPYLDAFGAIVAGAKREGDTYRSRFVLTVK